jgi:glycosyltransferase involved in cell wall biosynthesis
VGYVEDPEVYYRASDVFAFPSRNESFGNVLAEAMACGTACIATRIEGVTEQLIVNRYNGIIVEQNDHKALADAIVCILSAPALKSDLAGNAARTIKERFGGVVVAGTLREVYEGVIYDNSAASRLGNGNLQKNNSTKANREPYEVF